MRLTNGVEVVATRADYDRGEGVLLFDGAVRATDGEYAFGADRVFVFLDGTNELRRVVADGNVTVENGPRSGSCPRATYVRPLGQVVMYGDGPGRPARLKEEAERRNELEGRKITFWLDSEQVEVEDATFMRSNGERSSSARALRSFLDIGSVSRIAITLSHTESLRNTDGSCAR